MELFLGSLKTIWDTLCFTLGLGKKLTLACDPDNFILIDRFYVLYISQNIEQERGLAQKTVPRRNFTDRNETHSTDSPSFCVIGNGRRFYTCQVYVKIECDVLPDQAPKRNNTVPS